MYSIQQAQMVTPEFVRACPDWVDIVQHRMLWELSNQLMNILSDGKPRVVQLGNVEIEPSQYAYPYYGMYRASMRIDMEDIHIQKISPIPYIKFELETIDWMLPLDVPVKGRFRAKDLVPVLTDNTIYWYLTDNNGNVRAFQKIYGLGSYVWERIW